MMNDVLIAEKICREKIKEIHSYRSKGKKHPALRMDETILEFGNAINASGLLSHKISSEIKSRLKDLIDLGMISPETIDKALPPEFKNHNLARGIKRDKTLGSANSGAARSVTNVTLVSGVVINSGSVDGLGTDFSGTLEVSSGVMTNNLVDLGSGVSFGASEENHHQEIAVASGIEALSGAAGSAISGAENLANNNSSFIVCNSSSRFENLNAPESLGTSSIIIRVISGTTIVTKGPTTSISGHVVEAEGAVMLNVNGAPLIIEPQALSLSGSLHSGHSGDTAQQPQIPPPDYPGLIKVYGEVIVQLIELYNPQIKEELSKIIPPQPTSSGYSSSTNKFLAFCGSTNNSGQQSGVFYSCFQG